MSKLNKKYFQPNMKYTREMAEQRLISLGYSNFTFKSSCYSNGASFYFTSEDGKEIRVSDHRLTGKRALTTLDIAIVDVKTIGVNKNLKSEELKTRIAAAIAVKNA